MDAQPMLGTSTTASPPPPFSLDHGRSLHAWLARMRRDRPVHRDPWTGVWTLYRYADVAAAAADASAFSSETWRLSPGGLGTQALTVGNLTAMDPPRHRLLRNLVSPWFTARAVARLAPRIEQIAEELLDRVADQDGMDLVQGLSRPLPVMVISDLLGLPRSDCDQLGDWADRLMSFDGTDARDLAAQQRSADIQRTVLDYLRGQFRRRQAAPGDDLISQLTRADIEGQRLGEDEAVNFVNLLLLAGHVTTTQMLANLVLSLDEHDLLGAVRDGPALIPGAIEETLRYRPVISSNMRITTRPVTVAGQSVPARQFVSLSFLSANRDEQQFPEPDRFDVRRHPNRHLGFGHGIHYCLGAPLAHLEIAIALRALLCRFPTCKVAGGQILYYEMPGVVGPRSLPVVFQR